jgi:hypothetical protein
LLLDRWPRSSGDRLQPLWEPIPANGAQHLGGQSRFEFAEQFDSRWHSTDATAKLDDVFRGGTCAQAMKVFSPALQAHLGERVKSVGEQGHSVRHCLLR